MEEAQRYLDALNENRLLVFLECKDGEECKDGMEAHFHQVKLTQRQFKKVSDAIILKEKADPTLRDGYNLATIRLGGTFPAEPFDGLSSTI